jgi:hypothetical protein
MQSAERGGDDGNAQIVGKHDGSAHDFCVEHLKSYQKPELQRKAGEGLDL